MALETRDIFQQWGLAHKALRNEHQEVKKHKSGVHYERRTRYQNMLVKTKVVDDRFNSLLECKGSWKQ